MRVKALFLASLLLLTLVSSTIARAELKSNFLLGGELGIESRRAHFTSRYQIVNVPALVPAPFDAVLNVNSVRVADAGSFAGLLGGWQVHCSRWLAGIEANVDFHNFDKHKDFVISDVLVFPPFGPTAATVEYNRGNTYGVTLRGGYWWTPFFMSYVKAGVQYSRDELTYVIPARQLPPVSEPINYKKDDIWGVLAGVGVEFPAFANSSVRFEYNYIRTDRFLIDDNVGSMVGVHRIKYPESHVGKIAWVWNFM